MTKQTRRSNRPAANVAAADHTDQTLAADRRIVQRSGGKVTEEQYTEALERLSAGDTLRNVTDTLGVTRSALHVRATEDAEFERMLMVALRMGTWARLENAEDGLRKGEFSTGEVKRDIALMDFAKWMAARLNRDIFGDRATVDVSLSIAPVMLPTIALPTIPDAEFDEILDQELD